ncbi:DNA-3-methyladenine glycosylase [Chryseobacterium indoltheticum]|uniref:Putative 3-methyladenine DNA glycosylase n=1 Tax=Chryseobacterium indoltheticum TaxID=254 RepID=A0A3G6MYD3_9FLAO|nr:DNA-3-methyladenine glycosylase [Chryseobacterium indoltheticum]AZA60257.1 DNA-3-methyladenine glycosylase [Chryseobacterium indoltheticum]
MKLSAVYYLNPDVEFLAKDLLGKILFTRTDDGITAGIIVETEPYFGTGDQASHAYGGRRTARTEAMYSDGGTAYVYLCYGIHSLLNVVTSAKEDPQCVLIRSIEPFVGLEIMEMRRKMPADHQAISSGPGSLAKSLGIDSSFNKNVLTEERIWIEDRNISYSTSQIGIGSRIGIAYAQEHANLPLRFFVKDSKYVKIR